MLDHYDETRLLALIEGELSPAEADALRAQLAADPPSRAAVERMIEERLLLRSLEEPRLPDGLLLDLEPLLARPILVQPAPGEFRRAQYRQHQRAVWPRYAVAATILLGLMAGVWAAVMGLQQLSPAPSDQVAHGSAASESSNTEPVEATGDPVATLADRTSSGSAIHHALPSTDAMIAHAPRPTSVAAPKKIAGEQPAPFALVISSSEDKAIEGILAEAVTSLKLDGALVRNFSFEQAVELQRQHMAAASTTPDATGEPRVASLERSRVVHDRTMLNELAERARTANRPQRRSSSTMDSDSHLAGDRKRAPSYEQQIQFSGFGATHTVAVPASQLSQFLNQLSATHGLATSLRVIRDEGALASGPPEQWVKDVAAVRSAIEEFGRHENDVMILLPVVLAP